MIKKIIIIALLLVAVFGSDILPVFKPADNDIIAEILDIDTPTDVVKVRTKIFSDIVTDPTDRAKLALFNYDFATRIKKYNTDNQQVNDVYTMAGKIFFKDSMQDKYDNLAENILQLMKECMTDDNHILTQEEKMKLHEYFLGVSWALINKV